MSTFEDDGDDEDNFFSELDLDEIMALEQQHQESSDNEIVEVPPPQKHPPPSLIKKQTNPLPTPMSASTPRGPTSSAAVGARTGTGGGRGGGTSSSSESTSQTPLASQKKRFKFFKSAPTPVRLEPPSPVPDVSVIEFEDRGKDLSEFNDDEDDFFSELDLAEIIAQERQHESSHIKQNAKVKVPPPPPVRKQPQPQLLPTSGAAGRNAFGTGAGSGTSSSGSSPLTSSNKKPLFKFKSTSMRSQPPSLPPPSRVPEVSVIDIDDDEVVAVEETIRVKAIQKPDVNNINLNGCGRGPDPKMVTRTRVPPPPVVAEAKIDTEQDIEWKKFVMDFEAQSRFDTPWFQSIPITALNISRCRSFLSSAREVGHLIQLAKTLLSFLKELTEPVGAEEAEIGINELRVDDGYYKDLVHLLELAIVQLDRMVTDNIADPIYGNGMSQANQLAEMVKEFLEEYITGKIDLRMTRIPGLLVKLHPTGFTTIVDAASSTGNMDMLIPLCSSSQENVMLILKHFLSSKNSSSFDFEDDPDFQIQPPRPTKQSRLSPTTLTANLFSTLFTYNSMNVLPHHFRTVVSFEYVVSSQNPNLFSHRKIIAELFTTLNDAICQCDRDGVDEKLLQFVLSSLCNTNRILSDRTIVKQVKFKEWPYLWKFLNQGR